MDILARLKENIDTIFVSIGIPIFILIITYILKKIARISQVIGTDFTAVLITFNICVLIYPKPFLDIIFVELKDYFRPFYILLAFLEVLTLFLWIVVERRLLRIYNFNLLESFIRNNKVNVSLIKSKYNFPLFLMHSCAWLLVFVFIFINVFALML